MNALAERVTAHFTASFGHAPAALYAAPGRVNLIGEHTDYNDGFVLPCAIDAGTVVAIAPRDDDALHIAAADYGARDCFSTATPIARGTEDWTQHIRGTVAALLARGHRVAGADIAISGDVPQGAGLSSSASLGVALATALAPGIDPTEAALVAQAAENDFVGTACGNMDQLASAHGRAGQALLIDCRSLAVRDVPVPDAVQIAIVHSGIARELVDTAYNDRRAQCEAAAAYFGVKALRDVDATMLDGAALDPLTLKRARHVVTENARTLAAADALASGNLRALGTLMVASHASMRDDFAITVPGIDALVAMANETLNGEGGARMTGGGFGGCIVIAAPESALNAVLSRIARDYRTPAGTPPQIWITRPADGARRLA